MKIVLALSLILLIRANASEVESCLKVSDRRLGSPIGTVQSNLASLEENYLPSLRFHSLFYCVDSSDENRLTGI